MPAVAIGAVISGIAAGGFAAAAGTVVFGLTTTLSALAIGAASAAFSGVMSMVMSAISPVPKSPGATPSLSYSAADRTQMVRQPITVWRTIYGEVLVSGPITFLHTTGDKNDKAHVLLTMACHEVDAFPEIWLDDELVDFGDDHAAIGRWSGFARYWSGNGSIAGDADLQAALEAACPGIWTSEHRQYGRAKVYVEFTYDEKMFPGGIPQIKCRIRGKKIHDPRTGAEAWSDNAVLCLRDYLRTGDVGLAIQAYRLLEADNIASANVCDEEVDCVHAVLIPASQGTAIGTMTGGDGLAAAFDGTSATSSSHSATSTSAVGTVGKLWASPRKVARLMAYPPSSGGWSSGWTGDVTLRLKGSDDGESWVTLAEEVVTDAESQQVPWEPDEEDVNSATAYLRHVLEIDATGSGGGVACAELRFYEVTETEVRYALNGTVDSDESPDSIIGRMLTACAGSLTRCGGQFSILAGYYRTPTITLTDDDFIGPVRLVGRPSRQQSFNAVKGVFVSPDHSWQPTDSPPVRNGLYEVEDGLDFESFAANAGASTLAATTNVAAGTAVMMWTDGTLPAPLAEGAVYYAAPLGSGVIKLFTTRADALAAGMDAAHAVNRVTLTDAGSGSHRLRFGRVVWSDSDAPFTTSPSMKQRLDKIKLERARQAQTFEAPCSLRKALRLRAGGTVMVTRERFGWASKPFDVVDWVLTIMTDAAGEPLIAVNLTLKETAPTVYNWDAGEETVMDPAPDTSLPPAWDVAPPTDLSLAAGTDELLLMGDGTVVSRLLVNWSDPSLSGLDHIDVQIRETVGGAWNDCPPVLGGVEFCYLTPVLDGMSYRVRIRAVNGIGARSDWVESADIVVAGKTARPADVPSLSVAQNGGTITAVWGQVADVDLGDYPLRYGPLGAFVWESATFLDAGRKASSMTTTTLPPGSWTVGIKARDTSGNESLNATTFDIVMANTNDVVFATARAPAWLGTLDGFIRHDVSGKLIPDSTVLASAMTDAELWDTFNAYPVATAIYEPVADDVGFDASGLRAWATISAELGPGCAGAADPLLEIDSKTAAGAYGGYQPWTVGTISTARYVKMRARIETDTGISMLSQFTPTLDLPVRSEGPHAVTLAASGGTAVTFPTRFALAPGLTLTAASGPSGEARVATYDAASLTATGFTARLFDGATGAEVASGQFTYTATGA